VLAHNNRSSPTRMKFVSKSNRSRAIPQRGLASLHEPVTRGVRAKPTLAARFATPESTNACTAAPSTTAA